MNFVIKDELDLKFESILKEFQTYNNNLEDSLKIIKAYKLAKKLHEGVLRKSGEPYIIHPLAVAEIAVSYKVDCTTICASLLHDVVEDTEFTLEQVETEFDSDVAYIVDGVTKISKMELKYNVDDAELFAKNVRKLFRGVFYKDIRISAVKLFDRLHNMRTLEHMPRKKQIAKSEQTLAVFAPLAEAIGANAIKKELQDLCLLYLEPNIYNEIKGKIKETVKECKEEIENVKLDLISKMNDAGIENEVKLRIKNIYSVYISLQKGRTMDSIHDLFALQINLDELMQCYQTLGIIHANYNYINEKIKDYTHICKTTGYRALHTTILDENDRMIQAQIRTTKMALTNTKGILANLKKYNKEELLQLKNNYPFFSKGIEIDETVENDLDFYEKLRYEVLGDKIYVVSTSGKIYELPIGANIIDFAFLNCPERALFLKKGIINGKPIDDITQKLKNQDIVTFISGQEPTINDNWIRQSATTRARRLISEQLKNYK